MSQSDKDLSLGTANLGHWFLDGSDSDVRLVLHINNLLKKYEDNDFDENDDDDGHHHRYRQRLSSEKI